MALRLKSYQILAVRYRTPLSEIDIVASGGSVIAVIEVKARAAAALSSKQQARLHRAAKYLLAQPAGTRRRDAALRPHAGIAPPLAGTHPIRLGWRVKNFMPYRLPRSNTPLSCLSFA